MRDRASLILFIFIILLVIILALLSYAAFRLIR